MLAQEEARLLSHNYIGTEHLLLGLLSEQEGLGAQALESLEISLEAVRVRVEDIIGQGGGTPTGHIPFTPRAKKVLEAALREAMHLGHNYIGTEHILLGLLREAEGVAAQVLTAMGADLERVRATVEGLLDGQPRPLAPVGRPPGPAPSCPSCRVSLYESATFEAMSVYDKAGEDQRDVVVIYCESCGRALGVLPGSPAGSS